jgi:hypothetical protein
MSTFLLGDSYTLSDGIATFATNVVLATDTLSFFDSIGVRTTPTNLIQVQDSLTFVDGIKSSRTQSNPVADSIAVSDSIAVTYWLGIGVADTLATNLLDSVTATPNSIFVPLTAALTDRIFLADSAQASSVPFASLGDMYYLADSVLVFLRPTFSPYLRRYLNDVS